MVLSFRHFLREDYQEYASWFSDPELNEQLGPMDEDWLNAILTETAEEGETWAIFLGQEMVGVIEVMYAPDGKLPTAFTAISVKPERRRQGIARNILEHILADHARKGLHAHLVYIGKNHRASQMLFESLGFRATTGPDKNGYIAYERCQG